MRILQVSIADTLGGAEKMAWDLFRAYRERGHQSWLAVGTKHSKDPDVWRIPNPDWQGWKQFWAATYGQLSRLERCGVRGIWRLSRLAWEFAQPGSWRERRRGLHDFRYPGTRRLLELTPEPPDIVHCHNLHGHYFDLRVLPWLSQQVPVVLSLHDAWLLSGLCSHSIDCERWRTGCGQCPLVPPSPDLPPDATHVNWRRKARIYARSRLHVTTACQWLMQKVEQSILAPGFGETRVIPNGIDLTVFSPGDRKASRALLGLPPDATIFLFISRFGPGNRNKDFETLRSALQHLAHRHRGQPMVCLVRGDKAPVERFQELEIRFLPFQDNPGDVVHFYRAADVYLHAARADTFPLSVLEALACGTPVVATSVGGIPEQIKSLGPNAGGGTERCYDPEEATGMLVPPRDAEGMAAAMERLLRDPSLYRQLGQNAVRDVRERFDMRKQADAYLSWYGELLHGPTPSEPSPAGRAQGARPP